MLNDIILPLAGGIGLFLLGMTLMTDSLKAMAGDGLRLWLSRFTGSPTKAMFSGIGFTILVQSSTATTLATIGFVSAGVLSFVQAIGVIIGANIGTTSTGWMVAFLGIKFSISAFALPMIAIGAMIKLLSKDKVSMIGIFLAGFGLLFLGIDFLQEAMASFANQADLAQWSNDSLSTRLILVVIGIVMTIILQSSTAAITTTLAALASQAIDLPQALALVIGQNIGTVATAVLAVFGASVSAQRTAAVHVVFNVITAVAAFFGLMPLTLLLVEQGIITWDGTVIIAAFHTAFSLMGALIFMPFTHQLQKLIEWLLPERDSLGTRFLDESLFELPAVAIGATRDALCQALAQTYRQVVQAGTGEISGTQVSVALLDETLTKVDDYLKKMPVPQAHADQQHLLILLRLIVYSRVIRDDLLSASFIDTLRTDMNDNLAHIIDKFHTLTYYLSALPADGIDRNFVQAFTTFGDDMKAQKTDMRTSIVEHSADNQSHAADAYNMLVARRWLDRLTKHTAKMVILLSADHTKYDDNL